MVDLVELGEEFVKTLGEEVAAEVTLHAATKGIAHIIKNNIGVAAVVAATRKRFAALRAVKHQVEVVEIEVEAELTALWHWDVTHLDFRHFNFKGVVNSPWARLEAAD